MAVSWDEFEITFKYNLIISIWIFGKVILKYSSREIEKTFSHIFHRLFWILGIHDWIILR